MKHIIKKVSMILAALSICTFTFGGCGEKKPQIHTGTSFMTPTADASYNLEDHLTTVTLTKENFGDYFTLELLPVRDDNGKQEDYAYCFGLRSNVFDKDMIVYDANGYCDFTIVKKPEKGSEEPARVLCDCPEEELLSMLQFFCSYSADAPDLPPEECTLDKCEAVFGDCYGTVTFLEIDSSTYINVFPNSGESWGNPVEGLCYVLPNGESVYRNVVKGYYF